MDYQQTIVKFLKSRVLQHLAFWTFAAVTLAAFFAKEYGETFLTINLIYTGLFLLGIALVVYINLLVLIPNFLQPGKLIWYAVSLLMTIAFGIALNILTFEYLCDWFFPGYYFISYYEIKDIFTFVVTFLAVTTLLKLARGWFQVNEQRQKINQLEREKLDAQLSALKSQINPHFLFNSLNSMYALSLDNDPVVSELILKLSAGMRYMLYETNEHFVFLQKELDYLNNYLDLQKLRVDKNTKINFQIHGTVTKQKIAPLIFIPFVENAFKHGIKGDIEKVFIRINLIIENEVLIFKVENNKGIVDELTDIKMIGGIGLENVKKRLSLLYKNQYDLQVNDKEDVYEVILKIPVR